MKKCEFLRKPNYPLLHFCKKLSNMKRKLFISHDFHALSNSTTFLFQNDLIQKCRFCCMINHQKMGLLCIYLGHICKYAITPIFSIIFFRPRTCLSAVLEVDKLLLFDLGNFCKNSIEFHHLVIRVRS